MRGYGAYHRLLDFVRDNMPHFEQKYGDVRTWTLDQWTDAVTGCYCVMENIRMYDDVDDAHCMGYDDLFDAFVYAHEHYCIDDEVYRVVERNEGIMTMLSRAISDEITA
jgi:hypothetical protein